MAAGYSGKPLATKLGLKDAMRFFIGNHPGSEYDQELGSLPPGLIRVATLENDLDLIHFFTTRLDELRSALPDLMGHIKPAGMIWISWPKKSSGVPTDLDESKVRGLALGIGLVDVKVCAVTDIWSGLKLVIRKENR